MTDEIDPRITKRRVTMTNWVQVPGEDGVPVLRPIVAEDYIRPDFLDAYVADATAILANGLPKWASVVVSDEPDAGPAGYDGQTYVPESLDHPLAGHLFPATSTPEEV